MLYLVRKKDESIIINGDIEVKIVDIIGKSVKLGFDFPKNATVLRKEVHDRIVEENLVASAGNEFDGIEMSDLAPDIGNRKEDE
jgi:carbon storage regulator